MFRPISQYAYDLEELRSALDLVEDHQTAVLSEDQLGIGQPSLVTRGLEVIEDVFRALAELPSQGGLAALARPEQGGYRRTSQGPDQSMEIARSFNHDTYYYP